MLVRTSFNDSQVMYWEPAKYVAKMRAIRTDHNIMILKTNMDPAGHGGASGRYDRLHEKAVDYAYFLTQMGIQENLPRHQPKPRQKMPRPMKRAQSPANNIPTAHTLQRH